MARAFLDWYSRDILLFGSNSRKVTGIGAVAWYVFVILGTAPIFIPLGLLAGVIESIQDA